MSCIDCDEAESLGRIAYFRLGNDEIGYGSIGLLGCNRHLQLAIDILRKKRDDIKIEEVKI